MPRLYIPTLSCAEALTFEIAGAQAHYLLSVMRIKTGDRLDIFNGSEGEWQAEVIHVEKKALAARLLQQTKTQKNAPDLHLYFAPIKLGRIDWLVEKATELGVCALHPISTQRTIVTRINEERLRAHIVEAAEQTERLDIPSLSPLMPLEEALRHYPVHRPLLFGDEQGGGHDIRNVLEEYTAPSSLAILIGPEGGFSAQEITGLRALPFARGVTLGPRILRADTAALAALSCMQMMCGDWRDGLA